MIDNMVRTHIVSNASHKIHEGKSEIAYIRHYSPPQKGRGAEFAVKSIIIKKGNASGIRLTVV